MRGLKLETQTIIERISQNFNKLLTSQDKEKNFQNLKSYDVFYGFIPIARIFFYNFFFPILKTFILFFSKNKIEIYEF